MDKYIRIAALTASLGLAATAAWAKLPPPPPLDEKGIAAAEEKKAKDAVAAEKAKAAQVEAEDRTVKNYHDNMRKAGKPIPKATPVVAAAPPAAANATAPAKPGDATAVPEKASDKAAKKS